MPRATTKLFESGRSQAVRIPRAYRFQCNEVLLERDGVRLILTPKPKRLKDFFDNPDFRPLGADFAAPPDPAAEPIYLITAAKSVRSTY